jgi:regulation of enolase protein 1 (concanavalin A-like superfamily)
MKVIFEEKFTSQLKDGWGWEHEEPSAWKVEAGVLYLRTLPGSLWAGSNNAHNFLLRPLDDFSAGVTTRVTVVNYPQEMGEQAGLIWYHDDDNYIKFVKESLEGTEWIVLARESGGQPELVNKVGLIAESAELQMMLTGTTVQGQFRTSPNVEWQIVGECPLVTADAPRVGVFTHGCPADDERWAELKDFAVLVIEP